MCWSMSDRFVDAANMKWKTRKYPLLNEYKRLYPFISV